MAIGDFITILFLPLQFMSYRADRRNRIQKFRHLARPNLHLFLLIHKLFSLLFLLIHKLLNLLFLLIHKLLNLLFLLIYNLFNPLFLMVRDLFHLLFLLPQILSDLLNPHVVLW